ncbi:MAG: hypothetical protein JNK05_35075 [Myxococcales bacterium]|nr:hypothetical protein [Myxococcales bacterium]
MCLAVHFGELGWFEQVVDRRLVSGPDRRPLAVSLRAIALTMRGFTNEAKALLATIEPSDGWNRLAHALVARAEGAVVSDLPAAHEIWADQRALRMLIDAVSRPQSNAYRAQRSPDGRYAFQSWLERFCPAIVLDPPPFRVSTEEHPASWDFASEVAPARRPRPLVADTTVSVVLGISIAAISALRYFVAISSKVLQGAIVVATSIALLLMILLDPQTQLRHWLLRRRLRGLDTLSPSKGSPVSWVASRIADEAATAGFHTVAAEVAETAVELSFEPDRTNSTLPNWVTFSAAIEHIAWANHRDRAEALVALAEKLRSEPLPALRFHTRLALALASGERERAIAIACDLPDEIELDRHGELVAHALQAIALVPTERDRVLRRIELEPLTHGRLRAVAPWVLEELATRPLPDDAQ